MSQRTGYGLPPTVGYPASKVEPATFGVCYGGGLLGAAIRRAERAMTRSPRFPDGDVQASWAGHCVVRVPDHDFGKGLEPAIVQAEWPRVVLSPASAHPDAVWGIRQPLSDEQRQRGVDKVMSLIGDHYDPLVYGWYALKLVNTELSGDLTALFTDTRWGQIICSGLVVVDQLAMGVDVSKLSTAATTDPDFTCPADVFRWGLDNHWMDWAPPLAAKVG